MKKQTPQEKALYNRDFQLRTRFGMTANQYDELLSKQGGRCAICNETETVTRRDRPIQRLCVDHCHTSEKVRGLLCQRCNRAIGLCKDNPHLLKSMAMYLERADTGYVVGTGSRRGEDLLKELI